MTKKLIAFLLAFSCMFSMFFLVNKSKFISYANEELTLAKSSKSALLIDANTNTIIFEKEKSNKLPIASMTKMYSLAVIFDAIDSGKIKLDQPVYISSNAASTEGSQAFLDENSSYLVKDLIKTVVIASANDSTVALAEAVSGSEEQFVKEMNKKVKELNLEGTHLSNSTGLPAPEHYSTAYDCSQIYKSIMNNDIYKEYSHIWMDELIHPSGRKTEIVNTNRLVKTYKGCSSGKTGYTEEAKYCLTCSATKNGMQLIAVVIAEPDSKTRFAEVAEMFNYGFANFENKMILNADENEVIIKTSRGQVGQITAKPQENYYQFNKKGESTKLTYKIIPNKATAPVKFGDTVGVVQILNDKGEVIKEINLVSTSEDNERTYGNYLKHLIEVW